jgi:glycosyltransferase involved in cell wall biosynthesis
VKILVVGRLSGWMGVHIRQFAEGVRSLGHEPTLLDYRHCRARRLPWQGWLEERGTALARNTENLEREIQRTGAEAVLIAPAHPAFDFAALKSRFRGPVVFIDMDGPNLPCYEEGSEWVDDVDLLVSVSRVTERRLRAEGYERVRYLPHGVDPVAYAPQMLSAGERGRFGSKIAFVGSATERRAAHLAGFDGGVVLWGRSWSRRSFRRDPRLTGCVRTGRDVVGPELVKVYNASTLVAGVQREALCDPPTIMNLQVFAVPCSGSCLLTEWVEEIEEAFDPGEEILVFRDPEEFAEKAQRYAADPEEARRIGRKGRARCLAEHTHAHRARTLFDWLGV